MQLRSGLAIEPRPSGLLKDRCGRVETYPRAGAPSLVQIMYPTEDPTINRPKAKTAGQLLSRPAVFLLLGLRSLLVELNRVAQTLYSHFLFLRR